MLVMPEPSQLLDQVELVKHATQELLQRLRLLLVQLAQLDVRPALLSVLARPAALAIF